MKEACPAAFERNYLELQVGARHLEEDRSAYGRLGIARWKLATGPVCDVPCAGLGETSGGDSTSAGSWLAAP